MISRGGATLESVDTPCLVLERGRLQRNLARMAAVVPARGVVLRVHLKTVKCLEIARLAVANPMGPVAVSTLREAEFFFGHGYRNIFHVVGLGPGKIERAARLMQAGANLVTMVDSVTAATAVRISAEKSRVPFRTVVEVDSGEHRGGVAPRREEIVAVARALGPACAGIATHAGQSYGARSQAELETIAVNEANVARQAANWLREEGIGAEIVSLGSSPVAFASADLAGVTELRAGVYLFWDLFQAGIGACGLEDLALTVLAEVIGRPHGRAEFLIDAGAFALSKDISTAALPPEKQAGYGLVCDVDGQAVPGLKVARVWQEHGLVVSDRPLLVGEFPVGSRVRVLPNHACPTSAAHDRYHVVDGSRKVVVEWPRINGW